MIRKAAWDTLPVGLIAVLVAGAIIRAVDKTENVAEARGLGQGRGTGEQTGYDVQQTAWNTAADRQRNGRGGLVQGGGVLERQYSNYEDAPDGVSST
jgi:hypothetical protein